VGGNRGITSQFPIKVRQMKLKGTGQGKGPRFFITATPKGLRWELSREEP